MRKYPESLPDGRKLFEERMELFFANEGTDAIDVAIREHLIAKEGAIPVRVRMVEGREAPAGTLGIIEGVFGKSDIINRNRRFYSKKSYEGAVGRAQGPIQDGNFLGEVDHPDFASLAGGAFRYTKLWMDADLGKFEAVILDTAPGLHLRGLLKGGVGVQISTRGYASSKLETRTINGVEIPVVVIGEDLTFEGIDAVLFASNVAGRITGVHTESAEADRINEENMTIEVLREKHADLVKSIEDAAREGYVAQAAVDTQVAEAKTAGKNEVLESEEYKTLTAKATAVEAVLTAITPLLPEGAKPVEESEADKQVKTLEAQVATLTAKVSTLESEKTAADTARQEAEETARKQKAVEEKVNSLLEGFPDADLVRADLLKAESPEAAQAAFESHKTLVEAAEARARVRNASGGATGKGKADTKQPGAAEVSEETRRGRNIAYGD